MKLKLNNENGAESARAFVKSLRDNAGRDLEFFKQLYDREPVDNELQTLRNLINRGNYSAAFVSFLVDKLGLCDVTLGEFYGVENK